MTNSDVGTSFRPVETIERKRRGEAHARDELRAFVLGYVRGEVPDYQVAAWLMAVVWRGMTPQETADLTAVMAESGDSLDLSELPHTVDKHSTGGVGDKTSLVLAPLLAACGATAAKMSGRGLGHTGGTIDKLESIPGFRTELAEDAFLRQAREVGVALVGQSRDLAPADGLLYALRDATGTVQSLPLIASSIMSKKLASGARSIVLDVKAGSGAFMETVDDARALARAMIDIGRREGRNVRAVISDMEEPLGHAVGNALEVREAIACLRGGGPADLRELSVTLASEVLAASGLESDAERIAARLDDGSAYERFERWIAAQGGDVGALERLEVAPGEHAVRVRSGGFVARLDALAVGRAVRALGGGRVRKGDSVDTGVGVTLHAKVGDALDGGAAVATVHHREGRGLEDAVRLLEEAFETSERPVERRTLILDVLR